MPWIRIDDHFDEHPKLVKVGPLGWGLWLAGFAYCNRNLTDGFIPWAIARALVSWEFLAPRPDDGRELVWTVGVGIGMHGQDVDCPYVIGMLVDAGLWDEVDGGYRVHDFEDYQPTKAAVLAERAAKAAAGRAGGIATAAARAKAPAEPRAAAESQPVPVPVPVSVPVSVPRVNSPQPPASGGPSRANGTNPRAAEERAKQARLETANERRLAVRQIRARYYAGEINEEEERRLLDELDMEPDDLRRKEVSA